jgi:hypothetical protein
VPGGHGIGINWCKCVNLVGMAVWNHVGCIADRMDVGDFNGREGYKDMVSEAKVATFEWEVGK